MAPIHAILGLAWMSCVVSRSISSCCPTNRFSFDEAHRTLLQDLLGDTPAVHNGRVLLVDGSLITWHGTRLAIALRELPALLDLQL